MLTQSTLLNYRFLSESALASAGSQPDDDLDMIKFLAVVEALNIEVLPITWQAAREPIGWGATSQVTEAQATVQTSFAFKRASEEQKQVGLPKVLRAMLNEITVLSHPSVRMHPGVVELQGICWDVQSVHDVWPVVVFRKSHFGNLYDFATMPAGRALSLPQRLDLCVEIGSAVVSMHANNIVHGDLKPENILIFQDEKDVYSAKVSDFGYSTRFFKPDDVCPMPRSRPWDAPEHHFNMFNMSDARKMDIFSFGLVCCWILFEKYLARVATLPASLQWAEDLLAPKSSLDCSKESISELKRLKKILAFAEQLLITDDDLEAEPKAAMLKFLRASLVYEQDLRSHDLHACFHYFVPSTLSSHTKIDDPTSSISSASFDMTRILEDLYASDYRVRKYLRRTLEELVNDQNRDKMHSEQQNLAFQLAICTKIGFGAPKDDVRVSDFLSRCQKPLEELQGALEKLSVVGSARATNNLTTWHILRNDEHVRLINLAEQYTQVDEIGVAMEEFSKELSDIENTLGRNNGLWSFHAHTMCLFYEKLGHWNSEMQILQQMLEKDEKDTTLVLNLAQTYRRMGRYSEAETLQDRAMEQLLEEGKENDLGLYYCMNDLAMTYKDQGRFEEAVNLLSGAIPAFKRLLGSEHPSTLSKVSNLGTIYQAQYRWAEATALFIEVKDTCSSILGERHPFSLTSTGNLADVYNVQNRYKEAEIMLEKIINIATDALGPNSDITLRTRCSLASSYAGQGQFKRAAEELEQALSVLEEEFGDDYPRTIDVRTTLGDTYCRMGLYGKAETLHFSTSMKLESVRGANHTSTILAVNSLAMTFREQGRTGDAEQIMQKNLQRCESAFGPLHYTTLHMQLDLAAIFMDQGRLEEAEDLMEHILRQEARMHDRDQMLRIDTLTKLVTVYRCQSRLEEAEKLGVEVIETRTALQGDGHSFVLESKNNLGSVLMEMGKLDDAVSLFTGVINVKEAQGVRDSVWLASKYCLVASYTAAKDWGEAVESGIEVLQIAERALGTGHRLWIKAADHVLLAYGNLGNVADFEDLKEEVLEAKEDTWKEISIDQVHAFDTISSILVEQGNLAGAQEIEEQKLHMLRELRGEDHFDTIASNGLLAWICEKNGQWTKAERLKLEVIDKNSSTLGLDHEHTVKCMEDTATFYRRRGDLENAEKLTLRVMEIRQRSLGNSHHETRETMKYLAAVMIARGKHIEARRMEETFGLLISESSS